MTKEDAIKLYDSEFWKEMSHKDRAMFQMFEEKLCMPFDVFHEAVEKTFGLNPDGLKKELCGDSDPPSITDIINMIPKEKRIVFSV